MKLYNPDIAKAIEKIKDTGAKTICIQLPDGMKPYAQEIHDELVKSTNTRVLIWLGSNFGACDIPLGLPKMNIDLLINSGHNPFHKKMDGW